MSRYDGLIIPRSYNDYFSRSDPKAIRDVVKMATDEELNGNSENPIQNQAVAKLIPATASSTNQLADKNFVNSTVGTNTANYIYKTVEGENVPFDSVEELEAYAGTVTQNDYAFVTGIDENGNRYFDRYKANETEGVIEWGKEYRLNNSSFTAEQWAAIESGITAEKIAQYDAALVAPVDYVTDNEMSPVTSNAVSKEMKKYVPTTRTVNNKALSSNITLSAEDVGTMTTSEIDSAIKSALSSRYINNRSLSGNITLTPDDIGALAAVVDTDTQRIRFYEPRSGAKILLQWGEITISRSISGGDNYTGEYVNFPESYSRTPAVILTAKGGNQINMTTNGVDKTGFKPRYRNVNTNQSATAEGCFWFAIGVKLT